MATKPSKHRYPITSSTLAPLLLPNEIDPYPYDKVGNDRLSKPMYYPIITSTLVLWPSPFALPLTLLPWWSYVCIPLRCYCTNLMCPIVLSQPKWWRVFPLPDGKSPKIWYDNGPICVVLCTLLWLYNLIMYLFDANLRCTSMIFPLRCTPLTHIPLIFYVQVRQRTDLRHIPVVSIDPPGCKDIDDALHCIRLPNGNPTPLVRQEHLPPCAWLRIRISMSLCESLKIRIE